MSASCCRSAWRSGRAGSRRRRGRPRGGSRRRPRRGWPAPGPAGAGVDQRAVELGDLAVEQARRVRLAELVLGPVRARPRRPRQHRGPQLAQPVGEPPDPACRFALLVALVREVDLGQRVRDPRGEVGVAGLRAQVQRVGAALVHHGDDLAQLRHDVVEGRRLVGPRRLATREPRRERPDPSAPRVRRRRRRTRRAERRIVQEVESLGRGAQRGVGGEYLGLGLDDREVSLGARYQALGGRAQLRELGRAVVQDHERLGRVAVREPEHDRGRRGGEKDGDQDGESQAPPCQLKQPHQVGAEGRSRRPCHARSGAPARTAEPRAHP